MQSPPLALGGRSEPAHTFPGDDAGDERGADAAAGQCTSVDESPGSIAISATAVPIEVDSGGKDKATCEIEGSLWLLYSRLARRFEELEESTQGLFYISERVENIEAGLIKNDLAAANLENRILEAEAEIQQCGNKVTGVAQGISTRFQH